MSRSFAIALHGKTDFKQLKVKVADFALQGI